MTKIKKIAAGIMAALAMVITMLTASAENVAENWIAVYQQGAPATVNKIYVYEVPAFGRGYKVDCTFLIGQYDSFVNVTAPANITFRFTNTGTYKDVIPYIPIYGNTVTFKFNALNSTTNCNAGGRILYYNM